MFRIAWTGVGAAGLWAVPTMVSAQASPGAPAAPVTPPVDGGAAGNASGVVFALVALLAVFAILAVGVKLYDWSRRRREEGVALEARLSDVLLLDASLSGLPIVASVHMPLLKKYPPVVEVTGTAPTSELRDVALQRIERELAGRDARIEDHIAVDPHTFRHVA